MLLAWFQTAEQRAGDKRKPSEGATEFKTASKSRGLLTAQPLCAYPEVHGRTREFTKHKQLFSSLKWSR